MFHLTSLLASCALLGFVLQLLLRKLRHRNFRLQHQCFPPRRLAQTERLLGLDLMFQNFKYWKKGKLLELLRRRFHQAGNSYSATVAGSHLVMTIEPNNIKTIFADRFEDFDAGWIRRRAFAPLFGDVLITADGPRWRHQRSMLRPAFNKQQFSDYKFFEKDIDRLIARIPTDGSTVDLAPLFHVHALNSASRLLFDEPMASLNPDFADSSERFLDAWKQVNRGSEIRVRLGKLMPLQPRDRPYEAGCKVTHEYADKFVQRALNFRQAAQALDDDGKNDSKNQYVFLQELAKECDDPLELRNHLLGMLLVGSETTANLLSGCLFLLSQRQDLWNSLRKEALHIGPLSSETVHSFKSMQNVFSEVLRLYPILPLFGRLANKDTYLPTGGGDDGTSRTFIPKGTQVQIDTHALHRSPDIFGDDAEEFRPERWQSLEKLNYWSFLPFGGGPRTCIGQQFALMEASYTMVRLLQTFPSIEARDMEPWLEQIRISLSNGNGARVAFT